MTTLSRSDLLAALDAVKPAVASRPSMPVLACVLLARGSLSATDLELTIRTPIDYPWDAPRLSIPHAALRDAVAGMRGADVTIVRDETSHVVITSGTARARIPCFDADDYPSIAPPPDDATWFDLDVRAIEQVAYAISDDAGRPNLCGVHVTATHAEATDGHRLARCPWVAPEDTDAIIPAIAIRAILRAVRGGPARMCIGERRGTVDVGGTTIGMRLVEGTFPSVRGVIPTVEEDQRITIDRDRFRESVRAVGKFSTKKAQSLLVDVLAGFVTLRASDADRGECSDEVTCSHTFDGATGAAYNWSYLDDVLGAISGDEVWMHIPGPMLPTAITSPTSGALHVVMPLRR